MPITNSYTPLRSASCLRTESDIPVQNGLALTPAQIQSMTLQGVPISTPLAMSFRDGYDKLDFEPSIDARRGVDLNDVWEAEQDAKSKLREIYKSSQPVESKTE